MGGEGTSQKKLGARVNADGVTFCVWAPFADEVWVTGDFNEWSETATPLAKQPDGVWRADAPGAISGQEYKYIIRRGDQKMPRNDPRALQLTSSGDSSVIVDASANTAKGHFELPPIHRMVIYELHIGTFVRDDPTMPGTFRDAATKLDYLAELGINVIEVMPISAMWMDRWWGYTPNNIYAVDAEYGGRRAFIEFVRAAHERGIGVVLDVVYNHLSQDAGLDLWQFDGWSENNLGGIYFYNDWRAHTPWGESRPDFGRPEVRGYITDNVQMWLRDCGVDGLRIDSALYIRNAEGRNNDSAHDLPDGWKLLQEINKAAKQVRPDALMIAEDLQGNDWITKSTQDGGAGFRTQWDPSFAAALREVFGPLLDESRSMEKLRVALTASTNDNPFERVIYSESHDTDAGANGGKRFDEVIEPGNAGGLYARKRSALAAALLLTAPGVPMLFQGQEFQEGGVFSHYAPLDWSHAETYRGIVDLYKHLIALRQNRHGNTAGLLGDGIEVVVTDEAAKVIAYRRWHKDDDVIVVVNAANKTQKSYRLPLPSDGSWRVLLSTDWKGYSEDFGDVTPDVVEAEKTQDGFAAAIDIGAYSAVILSRE